ncbi:MAG: P1 family peptidase [Dehalococcoidia bacterium]|nr:Beta-peptidyl aminopeptidase BapA [Chloroflexota bacterium]MBT9161894.1 Beta-peptidyl aminopeptidase BapA [Chloroflexota bacterium]
MGIRYRARDLGIFVGRLKPGQWNAITDVAGVEVGHASLVHGEGKLQPGLGPVRTGVTAVKPHPENLFLSKVKAAVHVINGFGKSIGLMQIEELGVLETPILLTNTLNVGLVADALIEYMLQYDDKITSVNPVVCECNDSYLNDIYGRHVRKERVWAALNTRSGAVEEGSVGAGVGMSAFGFKGGIGTSSRILPNGFTVGLLTLVNCGEREELLINGVPLRPGIVESETEKGSIIIIVATDAPLSSRQLKRLAKRATHGLARTGATSAHGSGDIVIAFSTANRVPHHSVELTRTETKLNEAEISPFFQAAAEATEEAILNALFKAETVIGRDDHIREAIPLDHIVFLKERSVRCK